MMHGQTNIKNRYQVRRDKNNFMNIHIISSKVHTIFTSEY